MTGGDARIALSVEQVSVLNRRLLSIQILENEKENENE